MKSHAYPRYETDDINLAFRKAAAVGKETDIQFMKEHIGDKKLDINSSGTSGMTPLLQACKFKRLDAVDFLLANGADPSIKDIKEKKDAIAHAKAKEGEGTESKETTEAKEVREAVLRALNIYSQSKELYNIYYLGRLAYKQATRYFFQKPTEESGALFDKLEPQIEDKLRKKYKADYALKFQPLLAKYKGVPKEKVAKYEQAFSIIDYHFYELVKTYAVLECAKQNNFKYAYCEAVASSIFCYLLTTGMKFQKFTCMGGEGTHGFIVINREEGSDPRKPDTWGRNACFINTNGEVYPVALRPSNSVLNLLVYANSIEISNNELPDISELYNQEMIDLAATIHKNLCDDLIAMTRERFGKDFICSGNDVTVESKVSPSV